MQVNPTRKSILKLTILLGLALIIFIFGLFPNLVLRYYSDGLYPVIALILRGISSIFPFALGDLCYGMIIIYLVRLIYLFIKRIRKSGWQPTDRILIPANVLSVLLIFYLSFKLLWGLNYSRPTITTQLKIDNQKYSVKELVALGNFFIQELNALENGVTPKLDFKFDKLREQITLDYQKIALKNPFFNYKATSVKPVLNNWIISKIGIEGYYNPLSGEANVNTALPSWVLPFVTCHEISHQLGVAREDEANLVAYLVGINSENVNFRYSATYNMLRYILLEIRLKSPDDYLAMKARINEKTLAKFKAENEFWKKYNGQMSNYMGVAFDQFLKLNRQKQGIKSYQNIVIWLWNYHKGELTKKD